MGSKYESKLTAVQWARFADTIDAIVQARYALSVGNEEEVRYQVLVRVRRDPAGWAPFNYNPYQQQPAARTSFEKLLVMSGGPKVNGGNHGSGSAPWPN